MKIGLLTLAVLLAPTAEPRPLQRQTHDHTIYVVEGSAYQLARFQKEVGSGWKGGALLDKNEKDERFRYWAYSTRTASQAREFMFASMIYGLKLDIAAYEESRFFPALRAELDALALKCRVARDPFFITPLRELQVAPEPGVSFESVHCLLSGMRASSDLRGLPTYFLGNAAVPEEAK